MEESAVEGGLTIERLQQCKQTLNDKLEILKMLDKEILTLTEENDMEDKIKQADIFKEWLQQLLFGAERLLMLKIPTTVTPTIRTSHSTTGTIEAHSRIRETGVITTCHQSVTPSYCRFQ